MKNSKTSHATGLAAETMAACLLRLKGYRILARRYKTPVGEIDLVARRRNTLAFIEVKSRKRMDEALAAVTPAMRERIIRAAGFFVARHPEMASFDMRFDLVAVSPPFYWRHLDNAWRPAT
jgi:putative endonuclease